MARRLVLVAGPLGSRHGSYASVIDELGFRVPVQRSSGADAGGETRWAARFHQRLLTRSGITPEDSRPGSFERVADRASDPEFGDRLSRWLHRQFEANENVAVNDRRLAWVIPQWRRVASTLDADAGVVMMLRHPLDCLAESPALMRDPGAATARTANWINVMVHLEASSRDVPRSLVRTEDLHGDWAHAIATSCQELGIPILDTATTAQIRQANLAVSRAPRSPLVEGWEATGVHPHLAGLAEEVWGDLLELQALGDSEITRKQLDLAREAYEDLHQMAEGLARSTITAARRRGKADERKRQREASEAGRSGLLAWVRRAVPHRWRERIPVRWRKALVRSLTRRSS